MALIRILTISILCASATLSIESGGAAPQSASQVRLDKSHPSIYLTFDHEAPRPRQFHSESETGIWLTLHNNTLSSIALSANTKAENSYQGKLANGTEVAFIRPSAEVDACYDVEGTPTVVSRKKGNTLEAEIPFKATPPDEDPYRSCRWGIAHPKNHQRLWLGSGESVVFSVPKNFLAHGLSISTQFNYEWETDTAYVGASEPMHFIYFYSVDLELALEKKTEPTGGKK